MNTLMELMSKGQLQFKSQSDLLAFLAKEFPKRIQIGKSDFYDIGGGAALDLAEPKIIHYRELASVGQELYWNRMCGEFNEGEAHKIGGGVFGMVKVTDDNKKQIFFLNSDSVLTFEITDGEGKELDTGFLSGQEETQFKDEANWIGVVLRMQGFSFTRKNKEDENGNDGATGARINTKKEP